MYVRADIHVAIDCRDVTINKSTVDTKVSAVPQLSNLIET